MRRPLPPDLAELGDRLERAAAAALARRQVRRQQVLGTVASLAIAVPLVLSLGTSRIAATPGPVTSVPPVTAGQGTATTIPDDVLPRDLRRQRLAPDREILVLPSSLRPALR